jgi:hypothetical protein
MHNRKDIARGGLAACLLAAGLLLSIASTPAVAFARATTDGQTPVTGTPSDHQDTETR